jgi:hypothetical protein
MTAPKPPPPHYWTTLIALGSLGLSALGLLMASNKSDTEATERLRDRVCRLEAVEQIGDCKR